MESYAATLNNVNPMVVTVQEAAKIMRVGKNTVYDMVNKGQLSSVRVGRQIRINYQNLCQYLGEQPSA